MLIHNDVVDRLSRRLDILWKHYHGKSGTRIESVEHFANKILTDYLDRKDNEDKNPKINSGITWVKFRRKYFVEIFLRDKGTCKYCKQLLTKGNATIDHILPPLRGGLNTLDNVTISCKWCNRDKGILTDEEYFYKQLTNAAKGIYPPKAGS